MKDIARIMMMIGVVSLVVGLIFYAMATLGDGQVPGDIVFKGKKITVYVPIVSCVLASLIITLLLNMFFKSH